MSRGVREGVGREGVGTWEGGRVSREGVTEYGRE